MPHPSASAATDEAYDARAAAFAARHAALEARSRGLARWRLALAGVIAASVIVGLAWSAPWAWGAALMGVAAFAGFAVRHARLDAEADRVATLVAVNRDAGARVRRQWSQVDTFDGPPRPAEGAHHPYAGDLDVFGHASLWHLLGRARSGPGDDLLAGWLLAPAPAATIAARQGAVRRLAPSLDWRQEFAADALATRRMRAHELQRFLAWCEAPPWLRARPVVYAAAVGLAAVNLALLAAAVAGVSDGGWLAGLAAAVLLSLALQRPLGRTLEDASWETALRGWRDMAARFGDGPAAGDQARLDELRACLVAEGGAVRALDALDRVLGFAALRHTPLLHWPVQALTLWDVHVWWALEGWQRRHGPRVRAWLDALAEVEALAALAGLAHDHPDWAWPTVEPGADRLVADGLTHPLLPPSRAVANDVVVGPPGRLLFVTGSNMSGKSTLLRAIGLGAVLAQAGAPVPATRWRMPPLDPVTSMRLQDSLEDGVSFFMASLARLTLVIERARASTRDAARPATLFLLDELLSGTNTAEREVAVRAVVGHLAACRVIGALTSHDLGLADAPELRAHAECVHFSETIDAQGDAPAVRFDYRLRPGVATSRNALALMRAVGLGDLVGEAGPPRAGVRP